MVTIIRSSVFKSSFILLKEGIVVAKCELCEAEISKEDFIDGLEVCEDCKMKITQSPPRPCRHEP